MYLRFSKICVKGFKERRKVELLGLELTMARNLKIYFFLEFGSSEGIFHEFSSPIIPQQNGVVKNKNRTLHESARVMLRAKNLPYHFWDKSNE